MGIREHASVFWKLVRRWPRSTVAVLSVLAVFYFLYYAGVEAMAISQSITAAVGMVAMVLALKIAVLLVFYRLFYDDEFAGSFVLLAAFAAVPFVMALCSALFVGSQDIDAPPAVAVPGILLVAALAFTFCVGACARFDQWFGRLRRF